MDSSFFHSRNNLFEFEPFLHIFFLLIHLFVMVLLLRDHLCLGHLLVLCNAHFLVRRLQQLFVGPKALHWKYLLMGCFCRRSHIWIKTDHLGLIFVGIFFDDRRVFGANSHYFLHFLFFHFSVHCGLGFYYLL